MIEKEFLLEETVTLLRNGLTNLTKPDNSVRVMVDERCPPNAGEEFIGVYGGSVNNMNPPAHPTDRLEHGLTIGITRRCIALANEHAGENILTEGQIARTKPSLLARAREIIDLMLGSDGWTLIAAVNTRLVDGSYGGCFLVPLGFISIDSEPSTKGPEHWDQDPDQDYGKRYAGLHLELQFGGGESYRTSLPPA